MQIIILAAGEGKRIRSLTKGNHKSLLPINSNETLLSRLLHQLNEYEINKLIVVTGYQSELISSIVSQFQLNTKIVYNSRYKEDTNILSVKLAIKELNNNEPVIIIESDIYLDDLALKQIYFESKKDRSIWFTRGRYKKNQYGGILKSDINNQVEEIKIVDKYLNKYSSYYKLLGIMTIGKNEIKYYSSVVNEYVQNTIKQYYLRPWIDSLENLPCYNFSLDKKLVSSFNKEEEYYDFIKQLNSNKIYLDKIKLVDVDLLYPIENFISNRVKLLCDKILEEQIWTKPIIIDNKDYLIMDGHHRFQVAKNINLKKIPVIAVEYDNIEIWSLKEKETVSKKIVRSRALNGDIYPHKTVKHSFNFEVGNCSIKLDKLR